MTIRVWKNETVLRFAQLNNAVDPEEAVRRRARELAASLAGPPYDLNHEQVLSALNIAQVRLVSGLTADGRIFPTDEAYTIEISSRTSTTRRRFTLGHELGHALLLPVEGRQRASRSDEVTGRFRNDDEEEYLCDVAAAELLMPTAPFLGRACLYGPSIKSVLRLAREFSTSLSATSRRFVEVNAWKCHIGFWNVERSASPTFQFGYSTVGLTWHIPRAAQAAPSSIVARASIARVAVRDWSDLGFVSGRMTPLGNVFAEAAPIGAGSRLLSLSIFERHPEQLLSMLDRADSQPLRAQPSFHFHPPRS